MSRPSLVLALSLGLAGPVLPLGAKTAAQAIALDLAGPASQLASALETKDGAVLKATSKLVVGNFRVVLISESDATGTASAGLGRSGSASQTLIYRLANLDEGKLLAMADATYASWQSSLQAAGYEVLSPAILKGQPGAERLGTGSNLAHFQMIDLGGEIAMMVTPTPVPVKVPVGSVATNAAGQALEKTVATGADAAKVAAATGKGGMLGKFGALGGKAVGLTNTAKAMGSVTGAIGDTGELSKLSKALNAALVDVTVVINFVDLETSGGGFLERMAGSDAASVKGTVQPTFVATQTKLTLVNGNQTAVLTLNRPVVLAGDAIAEVRDATTTLDKAGNISGAVIGGAIALQTGGGINSSKVNRREAVASATYGEIVGANLDLLGKAVAEAMRSK